MNTSINQQELLHALKMNASVKTKATILPCLAYCKIDISKKLMTITNSNLGIWCTTHVKCSAEGEATIAVNSTEFTKAVELLGPDMELSYDTTKVELSDGHSKVHLPVMPLDDYPTKSHDSPTKSVILSRTAIVEAMKSAFMAIDTKHPATPLRAMNVRSKNNKLYFLGTTKTIIISAYEPLDGQTIDVNAIIPASEINEIITCLSISESEKVTLGFNKGQIYFITDDFEMSCKLVSDGTLFPNVLDMIEKYNEMDEEYELPGDIKNAIAKLNIIEPTEVELICDNGELFFQCQDKGKLVKAFIQEEIGETKVLIGFENLKKCFSGITGKFTIKIQPHEIGNTPLGYIIKLVGYKASALMMSMVAK